MEKLDEVTGHAFFTEQTYTGVAYDAATGELVGLYILHPNNVGRCGHICNASYAVSHGNRGLHIGEKLVKDCVAQGKVHGFRVLQFNAVVAGNVHARHLYERVGFRQLGVIPGGFRLKMGSMRISVRIILNSLTPLISSEQDRKDTIKIAILLAKQDTRVTAEKTVAILYTMADKFLRGSDLEELKEVVAMTRLGQMLYDDGLKAGKSEGRVEGSDRMASLTKKLLEAARMADLQLALDDPGYREKLMDEYGIK